MEKTSPLTDESPMPFGMYRGKEMANVPPEYLMWVKDTIKPTRTNKDAKLVLKYIDKNLDAIELEVKLLNEKRKNNVHNQ